ncbi:hypothetical protein C2R22_04580 [Salinigranum rubrum]|uniref:Uncharacterized protein n=1 Tax=Salinigranum rubrum TaxID=755307 RepID=A0A2I8VGH5_9EURY|nr:hypothetical protein C2R22_04580 [Salinigranum rubrum]
MVDAVHRGTRTRWTAAAFLPTRSLADGAASNPRAPFARSTRSLPRANRTAVARDGHGSVRDRHTRGMSE